MTARRSFAPSTGVRAEATKDIPQATIDRLPVYLRVLASLVERGVATVPSAHLAQLAGVGSAMLRKDLSHLGSYGTRGVGYDCDFLLGQLSGVLGVSGRCPVIIVGIGNLGHALAGYAGLRARGVELVGLLDSSPAVIGQEVAGHLVRDIADLTAVVEEQDVAIAVLALPAEHAQAVAERLVACGVRSILNFAPVVLRVPDGVTVRRLDLASELQILAFHGQRREATECADLDDLDHLDDLLEVTS